MNNNASGLMGNRLATKVLNKLLAIRVGMHG